MESITSDNLISFGVQFFSFLAAGLAVAKIAMKKKESKTAEHKQLINSMLNHNKSLQKSFEDLTQTNAEIRDNIRLWMLKFEQGHSNVIVENKKQMNVLRESLNLAKKMDWISEMIKVREENSIENTFWVIEKIKTRTNNVIKKYDNKYRLIEGTEPFMIGYRRIVEHIEEKDYYKQAYKIICSAKDENIRQRLGNLWDIIISELFDRYKEYL